MLKVTLIELPIKSQKWLCLGIYKPLSQNEKYFLENISLALTKLSYERKYYVDWGFEISRKKILKFI